MSDSEFDDIDFDLKDVSWLQDDVIEKTPFSLPQHNIINEFKKYLEPNTRVSSETKKHLQRYIEHIAKNVLRKLSTIANDFIEVSNKKTLDIELIKKSIHYFEESNKRCDLLFGLLEE
jgi:histone H3/H4